MKVFEFLKRLVPGLPPIQPAEQLRACIGALLGILITGVLAAFAPTGGAAIPLFIAPMGASAVLLFTAPASPLAQPWSVIGGNVVSALIGVTCALLIPQGLVASGFAVAGSIALMTALRCLHPPSAAVALTFILGGPTVHSIGYWFVVEPVLLDTVLLVLAAAAFNNLTGHRYPFLRPLPKENPHQTADALPSERAGVSRADIDRALAKHDEVMLVSTGELGSVLQRAEQEAFQRTHGDLRCGDIMSKDIASITPDRPLSAARELMRAHRIKALPVTHLDGRLSGILTMSDVLREVDRDVAAIGTPALGVLVGEAMTAPVRVATPETPIAVLVAPMSDEGLHAVPIVDAHDKLVGLVTQSDLIAAAFPAGNGGQGRPALRVVPAANDHAVGKSAQR